MGCGLIAQIVNIWQQKTRKQKAYPHFPNSKNKSKKYVKFAEVEIIKGLFWCKLIKWIFNFLFAVHDKIDLLNEKLEKDAYDKPDCIDFDNNISKVLSKKCKWSV